jgi:RimJ/RimL family protein N-acetyltransferase
MIKIEFVTDPYEVLAYIQQELALTVSFDSMYLKIINDNELIGFFEVQELTKITSILHIHILERFQNKGYSGQLLIPLLNFIKMNTSIKMLVSTISSQNKRMLSVMMKTPFKVCGLIPNSIQENNQTQDLILFQLEVA